MNPALKFGLALLGALSLAGCGLAGTAATTAAGAASEAQQAQAAQRTEDQVRAGVQDAEAAAAAQRERAEKDAQ
jgi:hypothetical protein